MATRYPTARVPSKRGAAFYGAYFAVLGVVLPHLGPYLLDRGAGPVWIGVIVGGFSLAKLVYAPVVGHLVDRGRWWRGLLSAHLLVSVVAAALVPWAAGDLGFACAFFLVGLGFGTVLPLVEAAVLERLPATGYGPVRLWGSAGFVAAALVSSAVIAGHRVAVFPVVLVIVLLVLGAATLPFEGLAAPGRHPAASDSARIPAATWAFMGLLTVHQLSHGPYYAFLSIRLEAAGYSVVAVGALWALAVIAEAAAFRWGTWLERRLGLRTIVSIALLVTPVRWGLLALPPALVPVVLAQLLHAVTFGLVHLGGVQLVQVAVPQAARRRAQALYSGLAFGLGIVAGSIAAGPLYAHFGGSLTFLSAAAVSILVALAWLPLRPHLPSGRSNNSPDEHSSSEAAGLAGPRHGSLES